MGVKTNFANNLIVDRTQDDVDNLTPKGFYNATDVNRVGLCVNGLTQALNGYGYGIAANAKTNWQVGALISKSQWEAYLANVKALANGFYVLPTTPVLPQTIEQLNWQGANSIENNLQSVDVILNWLVESFVYAGEIYCNQT